jgi:hypothetical protein
MAAPWQVGNRAVIERRSSCALTVPLVHAPQTVTGLQPLLNGLTAPVPTTTGAPATGFSFSPASSRDAAASVMPTTTGSEQSAAQDRPEPAQGSASTPKQRLAHLFRRAADSTGPSPSPSTSAACTLDAGLQQPGQGPRRPEPLAPPFGREHGTRRWSAPAAPLAYSPPTVGQPSPHSALRVARLQRDAVARRNAAAVSAHVARRRRSLGSTEPGVAACSRASATRCVGRRRASTQPLAAAADSSGCTPKPQRGAFKDPSTSSPLPASPGFQLAAAAAYYGAPTSPFTAAAAALGRTARHVGGPDTGAGQRDCDTAAKPARRCDEAPTPISVALKALAAAKAGHPHDAHRGSGAREMPCKTLADPDDAHRGSGARDTPCKTLAECLRATTATG